MNFTYLPNQVFVEREVAHSVIVQKVLRTLSGVPVHLIDSVEHLRRRAKKLSPTIAVGKKTLVLARHRGSFFKYCPASQTRGGKTNVCCNYFVVNFASNCHMECSYCYLQSYLNFPYMLVYANSEDLFAEIKAVLSGSPQSFFRIGTGELADSLALDPLTGYAQKLVKFFSEFQNAVLELKTKTDCVKGLLSLKHRGKTVVSWSMNTPFIQKTEEHKTASVKHRLIGAQQCVDAGYKVGFHFDPLIYYPDWEKDYHALVNQIFDRLPSEAIAWFSIGGLRMSPQLKDKMRSRFPNSFLPLGELVPSADGKLRYLKQIRTKMYLKMLEWLRERSSPSTGIYACMERPEVWSRLFGSSPLTDVEIGDQVTSGLQSNKFQSET